MKLSTFTIVPCIVAMLIFSACSTASPTEVTESPKTDMEKATEFADAVLPIVSGVMDAKSVSVDLDSMYPITEKAIADLKAVKVPELQNKTCQEMGRMGVIELINAYNLELDVLKFLRKMNSGEITTNPTTLAQATQLQDNQQEADELKIAGMNKVGALGVQYCLKNSI